MIIFIFTPLEKFIHYEYCWSRMDVYHILAILRFMYRENMLIFEAIINQYNTDTIERSRILRLTHTLYIHFEYVLIKLYATI